MANPLTPRKREVRGPLSGTGLEPVGNFEQLPTEDRGVPLHRRGEDATRPEIRSIEKLNELCLRAYGMALIHMDKYNGIQMQNIFFQMMSDVRNGERSIESAATYFYDMIAAMMQKGGK